MLKSSHALVFSILFFTIVNVCVKSLARLGSQELVFFRSIITIVAIGLFAFYKKKLIINNKKIILVRGLLGSLALVCFFWTLQNMPLATALVLHYTTPLFTLIFGAIFLQEKTPARDIPYFILAFIGVILIKSFDPRVSSLALSIGLISAVFSSSAYTVIRSMHGKENLLVIVMAAPSFALLFTTPYLLSGQWVTPVGSEWAWVIVMSVCTIIAQLFMTYAYQNDKASNFVYFNYLGLVVITIVGYFQFGESFNLPTISGMVLILVSTIILGLKKRS